MDLYEFFYEAAQNAAREKMLEWFARSHDLPELKKLSTEELRFVYAERLTIGENPPKDVEFPKETDLGR